MGNVHENIKCLSYQLLCLVMTEENQDNPEVEDSQEKMNQRHANHPTLTKLWSSAIISKTYVQGARQ